MHKKPVYHLFIPHLLIALQSWHEDFSFEVEAPHLSSLLCRYKKQFNPNINSCSHAFFYTLGYENEELPSAYYRYQVHSSSISQNLICADPVYLEVGMNDVTLSHKITDLTNDEADELIEILNKHFNEDGLSFIFGDNQCWYLRFIGNETIQSHDVDSVLLKNIIDKSTQSQQRNWQVIQNETQMLLHSANLNAQREKAGLKPVNSLWFHGAGKAKEISSQFDVIHSNTNGLSKLQGKTFAKAADCEWQPLPDQLDSLLEKSQQKNRALLIDQLFMPALENRLDDFQGEVESIDKNIIKPLVKAWQSNKIDIIIDACDGNTLMPQKNPFWCFWQKPKKLREIS